MGGCRSLTSLKGATMTSVRGARLGVRGGPDKGRTIYLRDSVTMIGRVSSNDIVVEETWVSRQHANIRKQPNGYWIEDLSSQNGTFVNGERVSPEGQRLRNMDRIDLGSGGTTYWVFSEPDATEDIPPGVKEAHLAYFKIGPGCFSLRTRRCMWRVLNARRIYQ